MNFPSDLSIKKVIGEGESKSLVWPRGPLIRRNTVTEFSKVLYSVTRSCQNKTVSNDNLRIETDRYNLPKIKFLSLLGYVSFACRIK